MGRQSTRRTRKGGYTGTLRLELEREIVAGRCVYCRAPALPGRPLTREHVIPRARGGRRKDVAIIVPACARCNHGRGCRDLIPFLVVRPRRISAFLDYLDKLSPESVRQVDPRVFAEIYAAVAILREWAELGDGSRGTLRRLSSGRYLHRRRYAARRAVEAVATRVGGRREEWTPVDPRSGASVPPDGATPAHGTAEEPTDRMFARITAVLALLWQVPAERVERELARELAGSALRLDTDGWIAPAPGDRRRRRAAARRRKRRFPVDVRRRAPLGRSVGG